MRVFIAINFDSNTKRKVNQIVQNLKSHGTGNFSDIQNLHLTLSFIGETDRLKDIAAILDTIDCHSFNIQLKNKLDNFGDIKVIKLKNNETLLELQKYIESKLLDQGFAVDTRKFSPHITLVRKFNESKPYTEEISMDPIIVNRVSLMESKRINGKLTYIERYHISLT